VSDPTSSDATIEIDVSVKVTNEGDILGSEVVQLYVSYPTGGITHPPLQLRGFAKAKDVTPGSSETVRISLNKYSFAFWDSREHAWRVTAGKYTLHVGFSCEDIVLRHDIELSSAFTWRGL
jgi:beta-glucosidase